LANRKVGRHREKKRERGRGGNINQRTTTTLLDVEPPVSVTEPKLNVLCFLRKRIDVGEEEEEEEGGGRERGGGRRTD
jgi:hypothetical protein